MDTAIRTHVSPVEQVQELAVPQGQGRRNYSGNWNVRCYPSNLEQKTLQNLWELELVPLVRALCFHPEKKNSRYSPTYWTCLIALDNSADRCSHHSHQPHRDNEYSLHRVLPKNRTSYRRMKDFEQVPALAQEQQVLVRQVLPGHHSCLSIRPLKDLERYKLMSHSSRPPGTLGLWDYPYSTLQNLVLGCIQLLEVATPEHPAIAQQPTPHTGSMQ